MEADVHIEGRGKRPGTPNRDEGVHYHAPGPTLRAFLQDDSFIAGIRGPFGSGKTTAAIMKLIKNMQRQVRAPDGWKRRRTAIVRNTYPELRTTTMASWHMWVPKHIGKWRDSGPPMHLIRDEANKIEWEVLFVALDRPDDINKLLGMELSDALLNEAREIPKAVLDGLSGRVGRYPPKWMGGATNSQILMDTNPPDTTSWWYVLAERDVSNERNRQLVQSMMEAEERLRMDGVLREGQSIMKFYAQPSGRSAQAENIRNLPGGYYSLLMAGKTDDWIKVYVDGEYGFVMDGLPMYPEYSDNTHGKHTFDMIPGLGLRIGMDFGYTPAATVSQRLPNGCWLVHDEFVSERLGIKTFADELKRQLASKYPGMKVTIARGDPAGDVADPDSDTPFKIIRAAGINAWPAPTQDPLRRREGLSFLLKNLIDGKPAIRIHERCTWLRKALAGGYHRRRLMVAGEPRYREVPEKNIFSHVAEALEYDVVSAGEDRNVTMSTESLQGKRLEYAQAEYNILG